MAAVLVLVVTFTSLASTAWSCVPQPRLVILPSANGAAGSSVAVKGIGFDPAPSTAEIRWNTADGPLLATADQADFDRTVIVPEVPPGLYAILVLSRGNDGVLGNASRATFQVVDEQGDQVTEGTSALGAGHDGGSETVDSQGPSLPLLGALLVAALGLLGVGAGLGTHRERRFKNAMLPTSE